MWKKIKTLIMLFSNQFNSCIFCCYCDKLVMMLALGQINEAIS